MLPSLIFFVMAWMAWNAFGEYLTDKRYAKENRTKILYKRQVVLDAPRSAAAYEQLGDAFREGNHFSQAIQCYETAVDLEGQTGAMGSGYVGGAGVEHKLRMVRMELEEKRNPSQHGMTLTTRQQVCRKCGQVTMPLDVRCINCGNALPVNTVFDTLRNDDMRRDITWEVIQMCIALFIVGTCLWFITWLPGLVRFTIMIAFIITGHWVVLKKVGPD